MELSSRTKLIIEAIIDTESDWQGRKSVPYDDLPYHRKLEYQIKADSWDKVYQWLKKKYKKR